MNSIQIILVSQTGKARKSIHMPINSKEILKAPQKSVSKLLSIPKIYAGSKKSQAKPNTHTKIPQSLILIY